MTREYVTRYHVTCLGTGVSAVGDTEEEARRLCEEQVLRQRIQKRFTERDWDSPVRDAPLIKALVELLLDKIVEESYCYNPDSDYAEEHYDPEKAAAIRKEARDQLLGRSVDSRNTYVTEALDKLVQYYKEQLRQ